MSRESSSPVQETSAIVENVKRQFMESEAVGIEVHVELPDGTKSLRVIWQLDRCVLETKKWLLSESGIPTPADQFDMVMELPAGNTQILKDDKIIDYYWDDLSESIRWEVPEQVLYTRGKSPNQPYFEGYPSYKELRRNVESTEHRLKCRGDDMATSVCVAVIRACSRSVASWQCKPSELLPLLSIITYWDIDQQPNQAKTSYL